ncbi:MAG: hypothetical protein FRX48_09448 [Lasallia pustulata]|uniref:Uncharacterized protein n=1 Tax=Lasallia pustulata TaxID=136370 RepID=A0A5M8PBW3_9LECA|nr:MAG: hypothetical protein FRX48_09448 [Lasallia pustulata]
MQPVTVDLLIRTPGASCLRPPGRQALRLASFSQTAGYHACKPICTHVLGATMAMCNKWKLCRVIKCP